MGHMKFPWVIKEVEIIFPGWPGDSLYSYMVAFVSVFIVSVTVEWLSHTRWIIKGYTNHVIAGVLQTLMYGIRVCLAMLVMLAVMSFDVGVFLAAVSGYGVGFFIFGSQAFRKPAMRMYYELQPSDLPPLNC